MRNYQEAMQYIEQLNTRGISLGLDRISVLLELLGNPQDAVPCVHVAGTNGKGSVCAFMDGAMQKAGLRIGRYISPTLYDYLERYQINGRYMSEQEFVDILSQVRKACEAMNKKNIELPTVFEVETAVAFLYFQQQQCDYVLLEVGMGGRLDSTNVISCPVVSIITPISMDHTAILGNTLSEIAGEKAGIIKNGSAVVLAPQEPEAMMVLLEQCDSNDIVPVIVDRMLLESKNWSLQGQSFSYKDWENVFIPLAGLYQQINAAVALEALHILQDNEPRLTDDVIYSGMAQIQWPGRFEPIHTKPLFIIDGAHNPAGAQMLADTLEQLLMDGEYAESKIWFLMGVFGDKDYLTIGHTMSKYSDTLVVFQPPGARGLATDTLSKAMRPYYTNIIIVRTAEDAVQYVLNTASVDDVIISFGSLSTIKLVQDAVNTWEVQQNA